MSVSYGGSSITFEDGSIVSSGSSGFKNKIINGAMMIDQRNGGASVTAGASETYTVDRWAYYNSQASKMTVQQNAGSVTPPAGFSNYLGVTSSSAYTLLTGDFFIIRQHIEGFNTADLSWGTASAATVTLSFWVRSSLTGTFGGNLGNSAFNRSYPFTYTISSANTWEQKTITVAGDTSGTWLGATNGLGMRVGFGLGVGATLSGTAGAWTGSGLFSATGATSVVGTSGATFYITGVQLEKSTNASSFEFRSYGTELALCQRYYEKSFPIGVKPIQNVGSTSGTLIASNYNGNASAIVASTTFAVTKRVTPTTLITYNPFAASSGWSRSGTGDFASGDYATGEGSIGLRVNGATSTSQGNMSIHWSVDAEL